MNRRFQIMLGAVMLLTLASSALAQGNNWKVTNLVVKDYDQAEGALTEVSLGETLSTSANAPFGPILILVEITGELDAGSGKSITLIATEGHKTIFRGTYSPGPYQGTNADGKRFFAPFWISSNGLCDPIKLTARVTGQKQAAAMTKTVKFLCGE